MNHCRPYVLLLYYSCVVTRRRFFTPSYLTNCHCEESHASWCSEIYLSFCLRRLHTDNMVDQKPLEEHIDFIEPNSIKDKSKRYVFNLLPIYISYAKIIIDLTMLYLEHRISNIGLCILNANEWKQIIL